MIIILQYGLTTLKSYKIFSIESCNICFQPTLDLNKQTSLNLCTYSITQSPTLVALRSTITMAMICSLSNEVPEEPVISLTSKHIFEKRLLEKYISENGTDPINGEPLSDEQVRGEEFTFFVCSLSSIIRFSNFN